MHGDWKLYVVAWEKLSGQVSVVSAFGRYRHTTFAAGVSMRRGLRIDPRLEPGSAAGARFAPGLRFGLGTLTVVSVMAGSFSVS